MQNQIYTIKQAAKIVGLPESTLRYYEKMDLIHGIERDASGYRIYSENNIIMLSTIACLNATGMSIGKMKEYISGILDSDNASERQLKVLKDQEKQIKEEEKALNIRKKYIAGKIKYWEYVNEGNTEALEMLKPELMELAKKLKGV